jgi:hypothetical protein
VEELWVHLDPMLQKSCEGNEISRDNLTPKDIHDLATNGLCALFVGFQNSIPTCVLAIQFFVEGSRKGAMVLALSGKGLLSFKKLYWQSILDWLKVNNIRYLDAYVSPECAKVYLNKFGFEKSCSLVRMTLKEIENGR